MKSGYRLMGVFALVVAATGGLTASSEEAAVRKVLSDYHLAMEERSIAKLAEVVSNDLLVLEGTHKNAGWADYRDNHIGPEMAEWKESKGWNIRHLQLSGKRVSPPKPQAKAAAP